MTIIREERIDRLFATRVEEVLPSGCHIWTGDINDRGYGLIRDGKKSVRAHRVAWERENGPIPDGMVVLHRCDVRCCVNPDHLQVGTQAENMKDMGRKGRARGGSRGSDQGGAKLTEEDVKRIRSLAGSMSQQAIADLYGIDRTNVSVIVLRKGWKHVH